MYNNYPGYISHEHDLHQLYVIFLMKMHYGLKLGLSSASIISEHMPALNLRRRNKYIVYSIKEFIEFTYFCLSHLCKVH